MLTDFQFSAIGMLIDKPCTAVQFHFRKGYKLGKHGPYATPGYTAGGLLGKLQKRGLVVRRFDNSWYPTELGINLWCTHFMATENRFHRIT